MTKKHSEPTVARHIDIFEADWRFLEENFGKKSSMPIGTGAMIRNLVRRKVLALRNAQIAKLDEIEPRDALVASRTMERLAEIQRNSREESLGNVVDPSLEELE